MLQLRLHGSSKALILAIYKLAGDWRRGWDSNPRLSFPNTRFPSVLLKPLGHLSVAAAGWRNDFQGARLERIGLASVGALRFEMLLAATQQLFEFLFRADAGLG
jgi:hypothetical protein